MKTLNESIPHIPVSGTIAKLAIQCVCPDTGKTGCFLFTGESHRTKHSRVTPIYSDLLAMFIDLKTDGSEWKETINGNCAYGFIKT